MIIYLIVYLISFLLDGALLSPKISLFTFIISADDGSRILINNEVVLVHIN